MKPKLTYFYSDTCPKCSELEPLVKELEQLFEITYVDTYEDNLLTESNNIEWIPTFDSANSGSIVFDGVDDFAQCAGSFTLTSATFVTWIKRNGNQTQYDGILFSRGTNTTGMNFFTSNQLGYHWNDAAATYNWASGLTIPNLTWCMIAVSVSSNSATAYLCQTSGITTSTNTTSHASSVLNDIKIAQDDAGSRFFNGNIAISQLYNRALSADEITQNFNALKGRFGL